MTRVIRLKDLESATANASEQPFFTTGSNGRNGVRGGPPEDYQNPLRPYAPTGSWQERLNNAFDVAETFDHIEDWNPQKGGSNWNPPDAPRYNNDTASIFTHYSNDFLCFAVDSIEGFEVSDSVSSSNSSFSGTVQRFFAENGYNFIQVSSFSGGPVEVGHTLTNGSTTAQITFIPTWIGDYGPTWMNRGKALTINYNNFSGGIDGFGPSRLTTFFGDGVTGISGYKKLHVFFMMKFDPAFFPTNEDGSYVNVGTVKFGHISSGFTDVDQWGTDEENELVSGPQNSREYGINSSIINFSGGGLTFPNRIFFQEYKSVAAKQGNGTYEKTNPEGGVRMTHSPEQTDSPDVDDFFKDDEWFGVEIISDIGSKGQADGSTQLYLYDAEGNEVGYWSRMDFNKLMEFDHKYNKFTFGGNRICSSYGSCDPEAHSRYYVDDFIIHSERIGPTYFSELSTFFGGA